ncbi:hypothetical protein JCM10003_3946 [Bacteroides pyogenes JCM 10003]|nr:hypothetical protein JCM10003_3946 [Bacteroides pyogenes JCM 10003]
MPLLQHRGSCPFTETGFRLREWDVVLAGVRCCACRNGMLCLPEWNVVLAGMGCCACRSEAPCDAKRENVPRESGKKAGKAGAKNDRKCENRSEYIFLKIYYYFFILLSVPQSVPPQTTKPS